MTNIEFEGAEGVLSVTYDEDDAEFLVILPDDQPPEQPAVTLSAREVEEMRDSLDAWLLLRHNRLNNLHCGRCIGCARGQTCVTDWRT